MKLLYLLPAVAALISANPNSAAADTAAVASIKPVHSLVAGVMQGVGAPTLLVQGAASPHSYSLKPSQASAIERADLIFWIGHQIETFLEKTVESIGANAKSIELIDTAELVRLANRHDRDFETHEHHDAHDAEKTGHEPHEKPHAEDDHDDGHDHDSRDTGLNAHIWLDPLNAKALVRKIEKELVLADPANAETYAANAQIISTRLEALVEEVEAILAPVTDKKFIVFHDAYHYFENRFGLAAAGSITISPEVSPGAERLAEIQSKIRRLDTVCVFTEPQFEPRLVSVAIEGTSARAAALDPLGADLDDGPDLYFDLIRNMANALGDCLSGSS